MAAVAEAVDDASDRDWDVHTIVLELDGQHGEFNLIVRATNQDMEECEIAALAHRSGGLDNVRYAEDVDRESPVKINSMHRPS